jgi:hypothetical protein
MNPLMKIAKNAITECCSAFFKCPLEGVLKIDLKSRSAAVNMFPAGAYKVFVRFFDKTDDALFHFNFIARLVD